MLQVRRLRSDEQKAAVGVWLAANEARGRTPSVSRQTRVRSKLADPAALSIAALDQDLMVGMALGEPGRDTDGAGPLDPCLLHVSMVFVHPARWGGGVGPSLVKELFDEARRAGYARASLWTATDNERAYRLYARSGMRPTGRTKRLGSYGVVVQFGADLSL